MSCRFLKLTMTSAACAIAMVVCTGISQAQSVVQFVASDAAPLKVLNPFTAYEPTQESSELDFVSLGDGAEQPGKHGKSCSCHGCKKPSCFVAGVEATFLWANVNSQPGVINTFATGGVPVATYSSGLTGIDQMYTAPRLWLGYQGCRWGIVGRWWDYRAGNMFADPLAGPLDPLSLMSNDKLRAYTADLEATRAFSVHCWNGIASLGVRHASLNSTTGISSTSIIGADLVSALTMNDRQFNGTGLTFGLQAKRPVGCHGLNLFVNARGSALWGDSVASATAATSILGLAGAAADFQFATAGSDQGTFWIGEIQAGVQWEHELKCIPGAAFLRFAGEYQYWQGDQNVSASATSVSFAVPGAAIVANANSGNQQLDLIGFSIATGFTY